MKNIQSSATSSSRRAPSPSPYILSGSQSNLNLTKHGVYQREPVQHQSQPKANKQTPVTMMIGGSNGILSTIPDPHKRSQSVTSRSNTKQHHRLQQQQQHNHQSQVSSPISNLQKALL